MDELNSNLNEQEGAFKMGGADHTQNDDKSAKPKKNRPRNVDRPSNRGFLNLLLKTIIFTIIIAWVFVMGVMVGRGTLYKTSGTIEKIENKLTGFISPGRVPSSGPDNQGAGNSQVKASSWRDIQGRKSLILVSNFNWPGAPGSEADIEELKSKYGDMSVYTITLGAGEEGLKRAKAVAGASQCGQHYDAGRVLDDPHAFQTMVEEIFLGSRLDGDGDGVCDAVDKCMKTPKGLNVDDHGCPLAVTISLNIEFPTGSSEIPAEYYDKIAEAAKFLEKYPKTKATIEGHTDSRGSADVNLRLSQQRADSLRQYLIDKFNINGQRLKAVGLGQTRPIADNKSWEGRSKNRRVDVVISSGFEDG